MIRHYELIEKVRSYIVDVDEDLLNKAYIFSMKAHGGQTRISGDPYFSHPLEVASALADLKVDLDTIIAALLHDVVEDTGITLQTIHKVFGSKIAILVDGVTKLSKLELVTESERRAENFKKLVLAMSSDLRVLLIKLADRLHNMQTLHHVEDKDKRKRIAHETLEIYAPFAERIGMQRFKDELENLAFSHLYLDIYESIKNRLIFLQTNSENTIKSIVQELNSLFQDKGFSAKIFGRLKTPYSIWSKMKRKNITFSQLSDIMAFRIIVETVPECYAALGIVHCHYPTIPGRFKDYISTPKTNQYQALHTGIMGPLGYRIELQIKTENMNNIADVGVAAHWQYKTDHESDQAYGWVRSLLEILDHASTPQEFFEHSKLEMYSNHTLSFTPKGELITLPKGASIVDFAYAIHSDVGNHATSGKVNGVTMPLQTILRNGDQVEVIIDSNASPSLTWQNFVVTGKASACIRKFIRTKKKSQFKELGKMLLQKECAQSGLPYCEETIKKALKSFHVFPLETLLSEIGEGIYSPQEVLLEAYADYNPNQILGKGPSMDIQGLNEAISVHHAHCCNPLPFDQIVGVLCPGEGIIIHQFDCENVPASTHIIHNLSWGYASERKLFLSRLHIVFSNIPGSLAAVSQAIAKEQGNIVNIKILQRTTLFWEIFLDVEVYNLNHLSTITATLRSISMINKVERV